MSDAQSLGVSPAITIGPIRLEGRALLAPMSGVSDLAAAVARRFGAALVFSEMVAAKTFSKGIPKLRSAPRARAWPPMRFSS